MADLKEKKGEDEQQVKKIRMIITSKDSTILERFTSEVIDKASNHESGPIKIRGPVRMPTKHLKMVVRKSPCGEGSKTWDRFEMRIHKRVIDFHCPLDVFKKVTSMSVNSEINVELHINE